MRYSLQGKYGSGDSIHIGTQAQDWFIRLAEQRGYQFCKASRWEDMGEHWDIKLTKNKISETFDIKCMKRVNRYDTKFQDKWVWIELHGVGSKNLGWLYGRADYIAFEREDDFVIVRRSALAELINSFIKSGKINTNKEVCVAGEAKYCVYKRNDWFGKVTLIKMTDITDNISVSKWRKT